MFQFGDTRSLYTEAVFNDFLSQVALLPPDTLRQ